jgi:hypothetical protein
LLPNSTNAAGAILPEANAGGVLPINNAVKGGQTSVGELGILPGAAGVGETQEVLTVANHPLLAVLPNVLRLIDLIRNFPMPGIGLATTFRGIVGDEDLLLQKVQKEKEEANHDEDLPQKKETGEVKHDEAVLQMAEKEVNHDENLLQKKEKEVASLGEVLSGKHKEKDLSQKKEVLPVKVVLEKKKIKEVVQKDADEDEDAEDEDAPATPKQIAVLVKQPMLKTRRTRMTSDY